MKRHYKAPFSPLLKTVTAALALFCLGGSAYYVSAGRFIEGALLLALILFCAVFGVRGYSLTNDRLLIHRLGWAKEFDLSQLSGVEFSPDVMAGSVRLWGMGGTFGTVGYLRNAVLGTYRAYATNSKNSVILDFQGDKVVVTPDSPEEFVRAIQTTPA